MALKSTGWTELTEPCKSSNAEDKDIRWGGCDKEATKKTVHVHLVTSSMQHTHTCTHTVSETTGSTGRLKGGLDILLMLSNANNHYSTTAPRREHRARLSQEITYQCQQLSSIPVSVDGPVVEWGIIWCIIINISDTFLSYISPMMPQKQHYFCRTVYIQYVCVFCLCA